MIIDIELYLQVHSTCQTHAIRFECILFSTLKKQGRKNNQDKVKLSFVPNIFHYLRHYLRVWKTLSTRVQKSF